MTSFGSGNSCGAERTIQTTVSGAFDDFNLRITASKEARRLAAESLSYLEPPTKKTVPTIRRARQLDRWLALMYQTLPTTHEEGRSRPRNKPWHVWRLPGTYFRSAARALESLTSNPVKGHPPKTNTTKEKAKSQNGDSPPDGDDEISERENEILRALLMLGATNKKMRVSRLKAARRVDPDCIASSYNWAIASLSKKGLIQSRQGPGGGIWLTTEGITVATALQPQPRK